MGNTFQDDFKEVLPANLPREERQKWLVLADPMEVRPQRNL